ncbi:MAG TPA: Ig-like domain-containing protein [Solirubrobacteraceae bacterium]|jgi:YVTN family beta-propeller protein
MGSTGLTAPAAIGSETTVPDSPSIAPVFIAPGTVSVGSLPAGVAATNTRAYVANAEDDTVSAIDLTSNPEQVIDTIPVGSFPEGVAVSSDGSQAYVANFRSGTLSIIDTSSDTVSKTVTVGKDPDGVIRVGSSVYVSNLLSGTVSVVDPTAGTVTATITLTGSPGTPGPSGLAVSQDDSTLYVDDARNGATDTVDLGTDTQTGTTTVGTWPAYVAVAGSTAYVANATRDGSTPGTVSVLGLSSSPPTVTHTVAVGAHPYGIVASPLLGEVFAANSSDDTISVVDTGSFAQTGTATVGTTPDALAMTPDRSTVLETNEGDNTVGILHVDQPPVNTVPGAQDVDANGPSGTNALTFSSANSNQLLTTDPDAGSNPVRVTLGVNGGTLTLSGTSGLTFSNGSNGSASMTFTGTLSDVSAALEGLAYTPGNGFQGADALTMTVNDQGNTGLGEPQSATSTVPISVNNVAPTVGNVSYSGAIGNTAFGVGTTPSAPSSNTSGSVLSNSSDANGDNLSAVPGTITTAHSGSVSMNADGTFTYEPPAGFTGNDTFSFQVSDGTTTSSATATVTVGPARVWYVDSSASGTGTGTSTDPFQSLSSAQSADANGDYVYLYPGSYTGGFSMQQSEQLIGRPQDLDVLNGTVLVKLIDGSGSTNPSITNSGGNGVTLADGDTIDRVDISSTGGAAVAGSAINSLTTGSNMTLSTSGSGGAGLSLTGGGNGTVNVGAAVQNTVGKQVNISGRTGGTTTLSGAIGGTGTGVSLTSNTGATINLTGAVTISTGSGAFTATGGGTVSASGTGSTLATTAGTALDVENTTIGSSNLVFQSISASGGANGIVLVSTGSSGHLSVTGDGSTAGSGGSITGATGSDVNSTNCGSFSGVPAGVGVWLNNTSSPSLAYMSLPGTFGNFGILGYAVSGFTLDHTTMAGTYGDNAAEYESAVMFCGLTGSASVTNDSISGGRMANFELINTSGTLNRLTMTGDTFGLNNGTDGNDSVQLLPYNSGTVLDVTVEDSIFQGARAVPFSFEPQNGATSDLVFGQPSHGNTVHNTIATPVGAGQDLQYAVNGPATFDINSNTFDVSSPSTSTAEGGVLINAAESQANAQGYFRNNAIGEAGTPNSGTTGADPALDMESNGGGIMTVKANNNTINQFNSGANGGVELIGSGATAGSIFNVTFTGNTIANPGTFNKAQSVAEGFQLDSGTASADAFTMCLDFAGNTLNGSGVGAGGDGRFRQRFSTKVNMPGYTAGPGGTGVPSYIQGLNPTGPPSITQVSSTTTGGGWFNASCTVPNFP